MDENVTKLLQGLSIDSALIPKQGQIIMDSELEEALIQLCSLKKKIEEAEMEIKSRLIEAGLKISSEFKKIVGERVKLTYQQSGPKYVVDPDSVSFIDPKFIEAKYFPISQVIDQYFDQHQTTPKGIVLRERKKILTITVKKS